MDFSTRLRYEPSTGIFRWREGERHAGKVAGCVSTTLQGKQYRLIKVDGKLRYAHRLAWLLMTGSWPADQVDHINRDGLDNRWANLRQATRSQNKQNSGLDRRSSTGVRGVYFDPRAGSYQVKVQSNGVREYLGRFSTLEAAAAAAKSRQTDRFGRFAPAELR